MHSKYLWSILAVLILIPGQIHGMWIFAKKDNTSNKDNASNKDNTSNNFMLPEHITRAFQIKCAITAARKLLIDGDLQEFLKHTKLFDLNPNHIVTYEGNTALDLACSQDKTGQIVKQLLAYGDVIMQTWDPDNGIWKPLSLAIDAKNWLAVEALLNCKNLALTEADITFAHRSDASDIE